MRLFADTSALYACLVSNDRVHAQAAACMRAILDGGHELHTSSYVLVETMALLQGRAGLSAAMDFERAIRPLLKVTWVEQALHTRATHRLATRARRAVSFVDCTSFVLMEQLGLLHAFSYDRDFQLEGFKLVTAPAHLG